MLVKAEVRLPGWGASVLDQGSASLPWLGGKSPGVARLLGSVSWKKALVGTQICLVASLNEIPQLRRWRCASSPSLLSV